LVGSGSISGLTGLTAVAALNTVSIDKREAWSAGHTLIEVGVKTYQTSVVAWLLQLGAVVSHPAVLTDTGTLAVVVCIGDTVLTLVWVWANTAVTGWCALTTVDATVVSSPPVITDTGA
jgi:hypothetical protein